jgi:hypothetical protein
MGVAERAKGNGIDHAAMPSHEFREGVLSDHFQELHQQGPVAELLSMFRILPSFYNDTDATGGIVTEILRTGNGVCRKPYALMTGDAGNDLRQVREASAAGPLMLTIHPMSAGLVSRLFLLAARV